MKLSNLSLAQWFPERHTEGVLLIPASKVDLSATRGIVYDRPERYVIDTPFGRVELMAGDWIGRTVNGNVYTFRDEDILEHHTRERATLIYRLSNRIRGALK